MSGENELIRHLNDELRRNLSSGGAFLTVGVAALGPDIAERILDAIMMYDDFCPDSAPWLQHDFGSVKIDDHKIFWRIMTMASPDPSDSSVTKRVLTIMLDEEY